MRIPSKKITFRAIFAAFIICILFLAYLAADRYLIEHVEIENVRSVTENSAKLDNAAGSAAQEEKAGMQASGQKTENSLNTATSGADGSGSASSVTSDDWNYSGNGTSISIREVSTGSGNDKITYFVADIRISDAMDLLSAFAKDKFGRNIVENTSEIASNNNAVFAVNGDYYGFRNDGILIRNGVIYRDTPARTGFAFYKDGSVKVYDETQTSARKLIDEGVWNTLSFGPALLADSAIPSGITGMEVDTNFGNHSIQGSHPRTGIGIIDKNHFVVIVADGRSKGYSKGLTLPEFASIFKDLGCTDAYNLDGGGSSTMYFMGRVVNNPLGRNRERGVSDILYISG
ncbi:MAG: phosphodiester glycosidase family protein [Clostridiaceae bacterium]